MTDTTSSKVGTERAESQTARSKEVDDDSRLTAIFNDNPGKPVPECK